MSLEQMRQAIKDAYPGSPRWHRRVDRYPDSQVIAIYHRMREAGKLPKKG